MMIDLNQLKSDREAGTDGPWSSDNPMDHEIWIVEDGKQAYDWRVIAGLPWPENRSDITRKQQSHNARRIARRPELEAAYIEVGAKLAKAVEALQKIDNIAGAWPLSGGYEDNLDLLEMCGKVSVKTLVLLTAKSERDE